MQVVDRFGEVVRTLAGGSWMLSTGLVSRNLFRACCETLSRSCEAHVVDFFSMHVHGGNSFEEISLRLMELNRAFVH